RRLSGSVDRSLVVRRVDCVGAGWNPQRRNADAAYRDGRHAVRGVSRATMVVATCVVHCWNRGYGWARSSSAEFVSLPSDLDVAALDSRDRASFANTECRADSQARCCAYRSSQIEHSTMGGRAVPDVVIASFVTFV